MTETPREPSWLELERACPISEVAELTSLSPDTIERNYAHLIVKTSPRRKAMKLRHALAIADGTAPKAKRA
jgi:hypothetical protein